MDFDFTNIPDRLHGKKQFRESEKQIKTHLDTVEEDFAPFCEENQRLKEESEKEILQFALVHGKKKESVPKVVYEERFIYELAEKVTDPLLQQSIRRLLPS